MADQTPPKGRPTKSRRQQRAEAQAAATRQRRLRVALIALGVLIVVAVGVISFLNVDDQSGSVEADGWDLPALNGDERVRLADFAGTPVVVNFFSSWCTTCDQELPHFKRISDEVEGEVAFVGVNSLETGDRNLMVERHGIDTWALARDIQGSNQSGLHDSLGGRPGSMPITAFYDAEGNLVDFFGGFVSEPDLIDRLQTLFGVEVSA